METVCKVIAVAGILLIAASAATAQDEWNFEVTPYFWAAGLEGDVEVGGRKVDVDVDFDDAFDAIDAAGGLMTVAQRGRLVVFGQFDYLGLDTDELGSDAPAGGSLQTDLFVGALAIGHRFDGPFKGSTIDLLGGVRYTWMENDLEITGVGRGKNSDDIVDAIVVVRPSLPLSERWRLNPTFSIGAGDSDVVWELQPNLRYQFSDTMALGLGYRRLHYDYEGDRGNTFDAAFHGLLIGLSFTF